MPLLEARNSYKPFEYPWAYDFWKRQQQIHWIAAIGRKRSASMSVTC